jgi:hypothetical protein
MLPAFEVQLGEGDLAQFRPDNVQGGRRHLNRPGLSLAWHEPVGHVPAGRERRRALLFRHGGLDHLDTAVKSCSYSSPK